MNKEEIKLLNEMKENCLNGAKYVDPKVMGKYNLLRKNEDRINELQQENKQLKERIDKANLNMTCYGLRYGKTKYQAECLKKYLEESKIDNLSIYIVDSESKQRLDKAIEYISTKKAIINTDVVRIFDLFEIDEQGYTDELLEILKGESNE